MTTPHERDLRKDKRRALGVGGSSRVHLVIEGETIAAKTVDLSPGGIGIVTVNAGQKT